MTEIDRLANWFMRNAPEEIHEGSAVDNAIRFMETLKRRNEAVAKKTVELHDNASELVSVRVSEILTLLHT